ncbi:MAG: hydrolase [Gammaproteobacteria bacterium]|nr:hydrolase [Gammaproteobacteria bacterium]
MKPSQNDVLMHPARACLLIIDVQERLAPHIHEGRNVIERCCWLMGVARRVGVPVRISEHYPEGLGPCVAELRDGLRDEEIWRKDWFSCWSEPALQSTLRAHQADQVVVCGMEAHVCVMQSALEMQAAGLNVFLVADAVGSQRPGDRALAIERMRDNGVQIVSAEMVLFEWARRGATPLFRQLHREFLARS